MLKNEPFFKGKKKRKENLFDIHFLDIMIMKLYVNTDKIKIDKINGKKRDRVLRLIFEFAPFSFLISELRVSRGTNTQHSFVAFCLMEGP